VERAVTAPESLAPTWTEQREAEATAAVTRQPPDYKRYHQARAASFGCLTGKSVLVVGCNRGEDCEYFIELGARLVVGVDVMDETGRNFSHPAVSYIRTSAEEMPLGGDSFDLVFAYATLEHVPDIRRAFAEMVRVAAPGGFIYSIAAPLWCARSGPHWGEAFDHVPWPHLRMTVEDVVALGQKARDAGNTNPYYSAGLIRQHLTDPLLFNRRRAHEYVDAVLAVQGIRTLRNDIEFEAQTSVKPAVVKTLFERGYTTFDLFGLTHMFVATKPKGTNIDASMHSKTQYREVEHITTDTNKVSEEVFRRTIRANVQRLRWWTLETCVRFFPSSAVNVLRRVRALGRSMLEGR
jgi:SAM-dependent methyltransferase